jgi:6-pyruvoyltetrahydropterin/6-carboxytetrahydropterin synthase
MIEISQEFGFDAAHYLGNGAPENRRLHGHSFYAEVTLRGEADPVTGFLRDFGEVDRALKAIHVIYIRAPNRPCRRWRA